MKSLLDLFDQIVLFELAAERLTLIVRGFRLPDIRWNSRSWRHASVSTILAERHDQVGFFATSMNSAGEINPRSG